MKIEKLTENKIRIILKREDFKDKKIDINQLFLTTPKSHQLFLELLNRAEKEVDFDTTGHKLLIEASSENEDIFIFTITKYIETDINVKSKHKKILTIKKTSNIFNASSLIYKFNEFEDFCEFCDFANSNDNINIKKLYKSSILYLYNNTYFLVIDGINLTNHSLLALHSNLLEFSILTKYTKNFKFKLKEYGKVIIKNNAINTGMKYFSYKS